MSFDQTIFKFINSTLANPMFDVICVWFRTPAFWTPLYLGVLYFLIKKTGRDTWKYVVLLLVVFALCDSISAQLIKPLVGRVRPCGDPKFAEQVRLLVKCGSGKSFPSTHATNHFGLGIAITMIVHHLIGKRTYWFLIWAFSVAFSQVYVGVHYPLDVTAGAVLGTILGFGVFYIFRSYLLPKQAA